MAARSAEHPLRSGGSGGTHGRSVLRLALGCLVALSALSMPLEKIADALDSARLADLVSPSWVSDPREPTEGAAAPAKPPGAELEKDGSNKTKKVHSAFFAAMAAADGRCVAPPSRVRSECEAERLRSAGPRAPRSARAPPRLG